MGNLLYFNKHCPVLFDASPTSLTECREQSSCCYEITMEIELQAKDGEVETEKGHGPWRHCDSSGLPVSVLLVMPKQNRTIMKNLEKLGKASSPFNPL